MPGPAGRAAVVRRIAEQAHGRVAVDGPDAAGKTTFAAELAGLLGVEVLHTDDFLLPEEVRHALPYQAGFDVDAIAKAASKRERVVAEGVFLLRRELRHLWDLTVYLHVEPEVTLRRALVRDVHLFGSVEATETRYRERYLPGQAAYRETHRPAEHADVMLDMTDPTLPVVLRWP